MRGESFHGADARRTIEAVPSGSSDRRRRHHSTGAAAADHRVNAPRAPPSAAALDRLRVLDAPVADPRECLIDVEFDELDAGVHGVAIGTSPAERVQGTIKCS